MKSVAVARRTTSFVALNGWPVVLFLASMGLFALTWPYTLSNGFHNLIDGVSTVGAWRVLQGEIPYRDFWTMYAPGHFYLLALIFKLFGTALIVEVVAASVVTSFTTAWIYGMARQLVNTRLAVVPAVIFFSSMYATGYYRRLGSFPTSILLIFVAEYLVLRYFKSQNRAHLIRAGVFIGLAVLFKHDIAGYTALAICASLAAFHLRSWTSAGKSARRMIRDFVAFSVPTLGVSLPVLAYLGWLTWPDMLQDLVIFPLTDFRYARPEGYPSLIPRWILTPEPLTSLQNLVTYINFLIPTILVLLGVFASGWYWARKSPARLAAGVLFSVAFLFHYAAAHVQINTHIVSMSVYAALLGLLSLEPLSESSPRIYRLGTRVLVPLLVAGWLLSLAARPAYKSYTARQTQSARLKVPRVAGFRVSPTEAQNLMGLKEFIDTYSEEDQPLFVGLHRHDVLIISDVMVYFLLDRPIATRYQELHPAIADTLPVQEEIVNDLVDKDVGVILLKDIFTDETLERVKANFLLNLPNIGATALDNYIQDNYTALQRFGPYTAWVANQTPPPSGTP